MTKRYCLIAISVLVATAPLFAGWDEGVAAFTSKNFQQAYQEFKLVVDQNPEGYRGHYMLGETCVRLDRKDEALTHLRKAYDLNPNDLSIKLALGRAYKNVNRYRDASRLLESVDVSSMPAAQKAVFYQIRGESLAKTDNLDAAVKDFEQLARLRSKDAKIQYLFGSTALAVGQVDKGLSALRTATQLAAGDETIRRAYVNGLVRKGRMTRDKAGKRQTYLLAAEQAKALSGIKSSYENLLLQTSAELGAGLFAQAVESGKAALAKNSSDWLGHYYLGQAYASNKQFKEAEAPLNQARSLTRSPDDLKTVWKQLGFTFEKQRKFAEAVEAYQNAGDTVAMARVQENEATAQYNSQVEEENARIREMEAEAAKLEQQLKELEGGGG